MKHLHLPMKLKFFGKKQIKKIPNYKGNGLSLQTLLIAPLILQVTLALTITSWLSIQNGQRTVSNITNNLSGEIGQRIQLQLQTYLETPHQLNKSHQLIFRNQWLQSNDLNGVGGFILQSLEDFPSLHYTAWANEKGQYVGISKLPNLDYEIELVEDPNTKEFLTYRMGLDGKKGDFLRASPLYDPRTRPWYQAAKQAGDAKWSSIYVWFDNSKIAIDAVLPVYRDRNKQELLGVIDTPITLDEISKFLMELRIGKTGKAFIIEQNGLLVASSVSEQKTRSQTGKVERVAATESTDIVISQIAQQLSAKLGKTETFKDRQSLTIEIAKEKHFIQLLPFKDARGLDWLIVIDIPEKDFSEEIFAITRWNLLISGVVLITTIIILTIIAKLVIRQIMTVIKKANAIAKGEWQEPISEIGTTELKLLAKSFNQMSSQLQESFNKLQYSASHDLSTGLPNRATFFNALQIEIINQKQIQSQQTSQESQYLFAVLFFDIDNFKEINDSFGHLFGDMLLLEVAARIQDFLSPNDLLAKFGGNEFTILLRNLNTFHDANLVSESIIRSFRNPFFVCGSKVFASTNIGVSLSTSNYELPDSYLRDADTALSVAKKAGKNRYEVFGIMMHIQIEERLRLETELRLSINLDEFLVYYQPIISLQTNKLTGFEALIRWNHPVLGFVSPNKFIQIAEESGQISRLTRFVLRQACLQLKQWQDQFLCFDSLIVNVNLSTQDFLDPVLVNDIGEILQVTKLSPHNLKLELTESAIASNIEAVGATLRQLRSMGIGICIDDFGTGYCSLQYLLLLPANTLKIDRIFIEQLTTNIQAKEIFSFFVQLAHGLNMETVAEGIEINEQSDIITRLNCDFGQGYLWSPPLPAREIENMLQQLKNNPSI